MVDSGLVNEEQFLLFIQHPELAEALQGILNSTDAQYLLQGPSELPMKLEMFTERVGRLCVGMSVADVSDNAAFPVSVHEIPTQIETFKSHNHINLMKSADIGQVVLVHPYAFALGDAEHNEVVSSLMQMEQAGELPTEIERGLTPPMRMGASLFKYRPKAEPQLVEVVESQLLALLHGEAPEGWVIEDVAEVWVPSETGRGGKWMPLAEAPQSALQSAKGK